MSDRFDREFEKRRRKIARTNCTIPIIIAVIVIMSFCFSGMALMNESEYTTTVTKTERVYGKTSKYLIFTEDKSGNIRVFENTDSFFRLKFNSSDLYAVIKEGETYTFTVVGYRIPFLSMYENIIEIEAEGSE